MYKERDYLSQEFNDYLRRQEIKKKLTMNGVIKKKNQNIVERIHLKSIACQLLAYLWIEVIYYTNHVVNISSIRKNQGITLEQFYNKTKLHVDYMQIFELVAYLHILKKIQLN
uniref:Uncharacterized protein n=1 Tax=Physcomitrium patens TaxID=3218 RepID=A0A2K1K2E5_PHYPA|nr:hypothetical protein PHYPA_012420 [Physcomitrium patens]